VGFDAVSLNLSFQDPRSRLVVPDVRPAVPVTTITNLKKPHGWSQAASILPDQGLIDAYNNQDYIRGQIDPGARLVRLARCGADALQAVTQSWNGWSEIVLGLPSDRGPATIVLNQNYHPLWRSSGGRVTESRMGDLKLELPPGPLPREVRL